MTRLLKYVLSRGALIAACLLGMAAPVFGQKEPPETFPGFTITNHIGWTNSGQFFLHIVRLNITNSSPTNSSFFQFHHRNMVITNLDFAGYVPGSLGNAIWTNFVAHTNGRNLNIWAQRDHPGSSPNMLKGRWNTNGMMWGMKGLSGLSPHCDSDRGTGELTITALTRRHGYTRGHGVGPDGIYKAWNGSRVWFLATNNSVVEVKVKQAVVRTRREGGECDYTIALFDRDLPSAISPLRVTTYDQIQSHYPFPTNVHFPHPIFMTEQTGKLSTWVWPYITDVVKGGDSGLPNMLPLPGELIFFNGRTTTGPSPEMQADMDMLCRMEKLNPRKYQMQWIDLSKYPTY
jgi:hypothetical protein